MLKICFIKNNYTNNKKIEEKHIGEQVPLMSNDQASGNQKPEGKPDGGQENSNQDTINPLKPQETQKGVNSTDIEKIVITGNCFVHRLLKKLWGTR